MNALVKYFLLGLAACAVLIPAALLLAVTFAVFATVFAVGLAIAKMILVVVIPVALIGWALSRLFGWDAGRRDRAPGEVHPA